MKNSNENRNMNSAHIKEILYKEIESMQSLLDGLGDDGEALSTPQKRIIKNVIANNHLHEVFSDMEAMFRQGEENDFMHSCDYLRTILIQFR